MNDVYDCPACGDPHNFEQFMRCPAVNRAIANAELAQVSGEIDMAGPCSEVDCSGTSYTLGPCAAH